MSNGIKWIFDETSLYSNEQADELAKRIQETGTVKESEGGTVGSFCILLVHTCGVTFDASKVKSESLKQLPEFLATWQKLSPTELWDYRRRHISHSLWRQWANDFSSEGNLLMADPAELPEDMLTEEQRLEASLPNSPLA
jgi:hypothetical protein